ncbi:flagellar biosynthetic protein FliR [Bdellovibrionota bacterium FG-1]
MNLFNLSQITQEEILTFFAVLMRYSVLIAVLPFTGDRVVPVPVKVLLALATSLALFPALVSGGTVRPGDAAVWGATTGGIAGTIACEVLFGLVMGYTARILFESISFGANLVGNFMGFSAASTYDPHQESQSQVVAQLQMAVAMLIFLSVDGHHLMLQASLDSYRVVGLGKATITGLTGQKLIEFSAQTLRFGIQLAAPVAVSIFAVNVTFGVIAKAMPQLNVLILSFAVTALVGLTVMLMSVPEFQSAASGILGRVGDWIEELGQTMRGVR